MRGAKEILSFVAARGEPITFTIGREGIAEFLKARGLELDDCMPPERLEAEYLCNEGQVKRHVHGFLAIAHAKHP